MHSMHGGDTQSDFGIHPHDTSVGRFELASTTNREIAELRILFAAVLFIASRTLFAYRRIL